MIKVCKLVDGSMVIGKVTEEFITDAIEIRVQETEQGIGIGFVPILFPFNTSLTKNMNIKDSNVISSIEASKELSDQYITAISPSGIIPASSIPESMKRGHGLSLVK